MTWELTGPQRPLLLRQVPLEGAAKQGVWEANNRNPGSTHCSPSGQGWGWSGVPMPRMPREALAQQNGLQGLGRAWVMLSPPLSSPCPLRPRPPFSEPCWVKTWRELKRSKRQACPEGL